MVKRSRSEIDNCRDMAGRAIDEGSKYPGMSYEEGVLAALEWVTGDVDDHPMEED